MNLISQPPRSRLCGQCVVAMILGISLPDAVRLIGKRGGTKAEDLRRALSSRGARAGAVCLTRHSEIPSKAILRLSRKTGNNWHWMLMWDGSIYDPASKHEEMIARGWQITSFIPLEVTQ